MTHRIIADHKFAVGDPVLAVEGNDLFGPLKIVSISIQIMSDFHCVLYEAGDRIWAEEKLFKTIEEALEARKKKKGG